MIETLDRRERTARKPHTCNYCGETILVGEKYNYAKLKYDEIYEWKVHCKCAYVSSMLWDYIDPDEGMTEDDFNQGCLEFCRAFICENCKQYDGDDCTEEKQYCIDKIYEYLQKHDFKRVSSYTWKCFEKEATP